MEKENNNKPKIIELLVEDFDGTGIELISFVDDPAIESDFMFFNKQSKEKFAVSDVEQRIVVGAAMIPDKNITRIDEEGEEFFVFFSKDTVKKCNELFFKNSNHTKSNVNHQSIVDGVTVVESWIVDNPKNDKSNHLGFKNIPEGTWMVSFKVDNNELWEKLIKGGEVKGFSIEGAFINQFSKIIQNKTEQNKNSTIYTIKNQNTMDENKTVIDKIKDLIFNDEDKTTTSEESTDITAEKFLDIKGEDGVILRIEEDELAEGLMIWLVTEEGLELTPDASYVLDDGRTISTDADSKIISIEDAVEEEEAQDEEEVEEEMSVEEAPEKSIENRLSKLEEILVKIDEKFSSVEDKIKTISDEPAEEEIKIKKTEMQLKKETKSNILDEIAKYRK